MEGRHYEGFGEVVQVLPHGDDIVSLTSRAIVDHASLHSRAEGADGVLLHALFGSVDDAV